MNTIKINKENPTLTITEQSGSVTVLKPEVSVVKIQVPGPQGSSSSSTGALPIGGVSGNILLKSSSTNYDAEWIANLDGGTFN